MVFMQREIDITKNIKIIERLKSEILTGIADLYRALSDGDNDDVEENIVDALSGTILICYILSRRLGIEYGIIESKMCSKLKLGLLEENDIERYYGDLSELCRHLNFYRGNKNRDVVELKQKSD